MRMKALTPMKLKTLKTLEVLKTDKTEALELQVPKTLAESDRVLQDLKTDKDAAISTDDWDCLRDLRDCLDVPTRETDTGARAGLSSATNIRGNETYAGAGCHT